ncbi:PREDICTED: histone deacetylase HDT1-like [Fragaria vesca subsp. vesca]|uniref:histone deacetylase HDT1-like n=1 Tax=Fragaria vesca subsp. vesca TaxID=101020 RepID=UPI0002C33CDB|nr:PREDICTED: histone deacetylase HDT1-like [Fragaria vesca subsp. vesca]
MEFWGVEVKAGEPMKVKPDLGNVVHLSQACLGEAKKAADSVVIYGKAKEQKLVLGHLIPSQIPQLSFDLVFDEEFELSHNWKNGSVHFAGYQSVMGDDDDNSSEYDSSDSEEEEEELPVIATENGKVENAKPASAKNNAVKPESSGKQKVKIEEPTKDEVDEDESASDMDDSMDSDDMDDSDDESEDDSDEEDEETPAPKKPESKKRAQVSESAKTPVSAKKAKIDTTTPQKTDAKKGGHTDTPHPAKKGKTPATDKSKAQTPKSAGGNFSCGSCSKAFGSDGALQSHNKAKHSAGK